MPDASYDFKGKVVMVTGAARGIGEAVSESFARSSARVVAADLQFDAVSAVATRLKAAGGSCVPIEIDVTDSKSVGDAFENAKQFFGQVDVLVHSAGITDAQTILETSPEDWARVIAVNLTGTFLCAQEAARRMSERDTGGRIILLGSQVGHQGNLKGHVAYAASKGGVHSMAKTIARTMAPYGITVNVLAPGLTDTPMLRKAHPTPELAALTNGIPLGMGSVQDVANGALFLASDGASHITGAVLDINGGMVMR